MNLKKLKIIDIFIIFVLTFIFHFTYDFLPNSFTAIFFSVNESIWEHMKLLYTPIVLTIIFDFLIAKKYNIKLNNLFTSIFISSILSIILYLIIYIPIHNIFGHNPIFAIILLFLIICLSQYISYHILIKENYQKLNIISLGLIIIGFVIFGYLTYKPLQNNLFYDTKNEKYGINIYQM